MLHKIIGHGSNGSRGVMDYMLKEKDKKTPRQGVTILRGDVETQAKLIDSLVGKFKQQYVTGVFSFEEAPDQITEAQKDEIMDGAEQTILAGLDPDRVSITWIEHTDKGRLELNYIVACVDLEHGRLFQPYVHSHDEDRFNAFRDIQNIKHGYSDPNDPAKAQEFKQSKNLPAKAKDIKNVINNNVESYVVSGFINNRDDLTQYFKEMGYTITRASKTSISIENPHGKIDKETGKKRTNLKFESTNEGGIYGINFDSSRKNAKDIKRASEEFRASSKQRFRTAQKVYAEELERKRSYHQKRHSRPKLEHRGITKAVNPAFAKHTAFDGRYVRTVPNPYTDTLRKRDRRNSVDDRELYNENAELDRAARASTTQHNQKSNEAMANLGFYRLRNSDDLERIVWSNDSEIINKTADSDIQARSIHQEDYVLSRSKSLNEQAATRSSAASTRSQSKHDQTSRSDNTMERARDRDKEQRYSSVESIIASISSESIGRAKSVTHAIQRLRNFNEQNNSNVSELVASSESATRFADKTNRRADQGRKQTNSTDESINKLSARHDEFRRFKVRRENVRSEVERYTKEAESREQRIKRLERDAERNRTTSKGLEQVTTEVRSLISDKGQIKQQQVQAEIERQAEVARQMKAEQDKQAEIERQLQAEQERSRSSSPRPF